MRLVDLNPRWYCVGKAENIVGFTFDCPCCVNKENSVRLAIAVHIDGTDIDPYPENPKQIPAGTLVWNITGGKTFDDLSVSPSVDASNQGHWHGFITNGGIV